MPYCDLSLLSLAEGSQCSVIRQSGESHTINQQNGRSPRDPLIQPLHLCVRDFANLRCHRSRRSPHNQDTSHTYICATPTKYPLVSHGANAGQ